MTQHRFAFLAVLCLILFSSVLLLAVQQSQETGQAEQKASAEPRPAEPTAVQDKEGSGSETEKLQALTDEVETRLEALIALISKEEHLLSGRETKLRQLEASLATRAAEVVEAEQNIKTQQTISWIVLALGIGAMIFAFVIPRSRNQPSKVKPVVVEEVKSESPPKAASDSKSSELIKSTKTKEAVSSTDKPEALTKTSGSGNNSKKKVAAR